MFSRIRRLQPTHYFAAGQIILGICILGCLVILPHYFFSLNQGGISNYGTEPQTKWLFATGFSAVTIGTMLAAIVLPKGAKHRVQLRIVLFTLAALYAFVMFSTFSYKLSPSLQHLHEQSAIALFGGMLLVSLWLRFFALKDSYTRRIFIFFCVTLVLGVLNLLGVMPILFAIEIAGGVIFALLMTHGLRTLSHNT